MTTDPLGSRAARKRALTVQPAGLLGAATAMPSGAVGRRIVATGAAGAVAGVAGAAAVAGRRGVRAVARSHSAQARAAIAVPPVSLLVVTAEEIRLHPLSAAFGRVDPAFALRVPLAEMETVEVSQTVVAVRLAAVLGDGSTLAVESKRLGANRHTPAVYRLVEELVAGL